MRKDKRAQGRAEKKKFKKNGIAMPLIAAAIIVALVIMVKGIGTSAEALDERTSATVYTESASYGSIDTTLPGSGTIEDAEAYETELISGVEVEKWYVEDGDKVEKGDVLGAANRSSVMSAITSVQRDIESLDGEIENEEDEEIYGTEIKLREELTDALTELLTLYQDPQIYAQCAGIVSDLSGEAGSTDVSAESASGSEDAAAESTESSGADEVAASNLTAKEVTAVKLATGNISTSELTAEGGSAIAVTAEESALNTVDAAAPTHFFAEVVSASVVDEGIRLDLNVNPSGISITDYAEWSLDQIDLTAMTERETLTIPANVGLFTYGGESLSVGTAADLEANDVIILAYDGDNEDKEVPLWVVRITKKAAEDDTGNEDGNKTDGGSGSGSGSSGGGTAESSKGGTSDGGSAGSSGGGSSDGSGGFEGGSEGAKGSAGGVNESGENGGGRAAQGSDGSAEGAAGEGEGGLADIFGDVFGGMSGTYGAGGELEADASGMESRDASVSNESDNASEAETASSVSVSRDSVVSITPQDTVTVTVTVDELDILSIEEGMDVRVTLDAFPGQSFSGTLTYIDRNGTNSGGSSKFSAVVTMNREEGMLSGMNASVLITLSTKENIICIPEAALIEEGGSVYVYTSYDEENDILDGKREVETGISDGENVEIRSGLEEGENYCYSYLNVYHYGTSLLESFRGGRGGFSVQFSR